MCNAREWQLRANLVICHPSAFGVFAAAHRFLPLPAMKAAPPEIAMTRWFLLAFSAAWAVLPGVALADGFLPPNSYAYLHPPPALPSGSVTPVSDPRVLTLDYLNGENWGTFTTDVYGARWRQRMCDVPLNPAI